LVVAELELLDDLERQENGPCLSDWDRTIQLDHRRARDLSELSVQRDDLVPVDPLLGRERGGCGLEHVRPAAAERAPRA
jgi:hypothetical protein